MPTTKSGSTATPLRLDRGIRALEEIARGHGPGTARSIGAPLGINQRTVYQILRTRQDSGFVHRPPVGAYAGAMAVARFDEAIEAVSTAILKAGDDVSRALGYRGEYPLTDTCSRHRNTTTPFVSR